MERIRAPLGRVGHDVPLLGTVEGGGLDRGQQARLRGHDNTGLVVPAGRITDEPRRYEAGCAAAPPGRAHGEEMVSASPG
ncbi:hypothetical protein [Streptomyces bacillaris]|uniref:hypothetical protein n=1 Tax=Streptomyces bacillaris TaxID=68179 RepID=UPI003652DC31